MVDDFGDYLPEKASNDSGVNKIIDLKLPLAWLITAVVATCLSFGGLFAQTTNISTQLGNLQNESQSRDAQISLILQTLASDKGVTDTEQVQITNNANAIAALQTQVQNIQQSITWAPGYAKNSR